MNTPRQLTTSRLASGSSRPGASGRVPGPRGREEPPTHARPRPPRRVPLLLALVVAMAVLVGGMTALVRLAGPADPFPAGQQYGATELVPFSFSRPAGWRQDGAATNVVFSPAAQQVAPLFGGGDPGPGALDGVPEEELVGMYTFFTSSGYDTLDPAAVQPLLAPFLPGQVSFTGTDSSASLDGRAALRQDGMLRDIDGGTEMAFRSYTVRLEEPTPRTVHLVYFSAADALDTHGETFDRINGSVRF